MIAPFTDIVVKMAQAISSDRMTLQNVQLLRDFFLTSFSLTTLSNKKFLAMAQMGRT